MPEDTHPIQLDVGSRVFDADGNFIGTVRGFDRQGFFATTHDGVESRSLEHASDARTIGETELLWRCSDCGAVGDVDDVPDACPDCGAPREHLYHWIED